MSSIPAFNNALVPFDQRLVQAQQIMGRLQADGLSTDSKVSLLIELNYMFGASIIGLQSEVTGLNERVTAGEQRETEAAAKAAATEARVANLEAESGGIRQERSGLATLVAVLAITLFVFSVVPISIILTTSATPILILPFSIMGCMIAVWAAIRYWDMSSLG